MCWIIEISLCDVSYLCDHCTDNSFPLTVCLSSLVKLKALQDRDCLCTYPSPNTVRSWPLPAIVSRAVKNVTRIILAIAVAHSKSSLRGTVSRVGITGFRGLVAKTEAFFSRWLMASYWNWCKIRGAGSGCGVGRGKRQQTAPWAPCHHQPSLGDHKTLTSQITAWGGDIFLSLASFLPSPRKSIPANIC